MPECYTWSNNSALLSSSTEVDAEVELLENHVEARLSRPLQLESNGVKIEIGDAKARVELNYKEDILLAKRIAGDSIQIQPSTYDVTLHCLHYATNWNTNIYTIDIPHPDDGYVVVSIIDYEPFFEEYKEPVRINFALRNISIMGFCTQ